MEKSTFFWGSPVFSVWSHEDEAAEKQQQAHEEEETLVFWKSSQSSVSAKREQLAVRSATTGLSALSTES